VAINSLLRECCQLRNSFEESDETGEQDDPTSRKLRIQIMALSHDADLHTSSSTEVWIRDGQFRILAEVRHVSFSIFQDSRIDRFATCVGYLLEQAQTPDHDLRFDQL
jgi:hypothetical protein